MNISFWENEFLVCLTHLKKILDLDEFHQKKCLSERISSGK